MTCKILILIGSVKYFLPYKSSVWEFRHKVEIYEPKDGRREVKPNELKKYKVIERNTSLRVVGILIPFFFQLDKKFICISTKKSYLSIVSR